MDWFRFYNGAIHDPKIIRLSDEMFRAWVTLLCLSSRHDGIVPPTGDICAELRLKPTKVAAWLAALVGASLLDKRDDGSFVPHNWSSRQYKTDGGDPTNASRQKRYRDRHRNGSNTVTHNDDTNCSNSVTPKRPETETETETETEQSSANAAPANSRKKPKMQMPDIFPLSEKSRTYAGEKGIAGDRADQLFSKFKNYHQSKGSVFANWDAAWRTWVDNEINFKKPTRDDDDVYRNVL